MTHADRSSLDDAALVTLANAGDAAAFEALYDRYREWILRSARVVTGNDDLATDVLQEVILYWLSRFPGFTLQGKVTSFLYPCVRHTSLEMLRKRGRVMEADRTGTGTGTGTRTGTEAVDTRAPASASVRASSESEHLLRADAVAVASALRRAFETLPLEQREVLHLAVTEGLAMAEIANSLDVPVGTVKSRLHHALSKLREDDLLRKSLFG